MSILLICLYVNLKNRSHNHWQQCLCCSNDSTWFNSGMQVDLFWSVDLLSMNLIFYAWIEDKCGFEDFCARFFPVAFSSLQLFEDFFSFWVLVFLVIKSKKYKFYFCSFLANHKFLVSHVSACVNAERNIDVCVRNID